MAKKTETSPSCTECGSEALDKALFCFHCGASLEAGTDIESSVDKPIQPPPGDPFDEPAETPAKRSKKRKKGNEAPADKMPIQDTRTDVMRMRRIETSWSADDESPNLWFLIAAASFFAIAFLIFLASMYLR